jgi:hypothetical protein
MNSDFFSKDDKIISLNFQIMPLASYEPKLTIIGGVAQGIQDESVMNNTIRYEKAFSDVDSINFEAVSFQSSERKHFHVIENRYEFYTGIKVVKFNLSSHQNQDAAYEAISKGVTKASINYDKSILLGGDGNRGIINSSNATMLEDTPLHSIDELIALLENMKVRLMEDNLTIDGFKTLLPMSLRPMIESSLSFTVSGSDRIYRSIGKEGVDFNYVPSFVDNTTRIIMSYAPSVVWLYTYTPQVLGEYSMNEGSAVDQYRTIEIGYGTTAIHSLNGNKAILIQPFNDTEG